MVLTFLVAPILLLALMSFVLLVAFIADMASAGHKRLLWISYGSWGANGSSGAIGFYGANSPKGSYGGSAALMVIMETLGLCAILLSAP